MNVFKNCLGVSDMATKQFLYNGNIRSRLCYICEEIFTGKTPIYDFDNEKYIIIGQKNNQKSKITLTDCKYANEDFYKTNSPKMFLKKGDSLLNSLGGGSVGRIGYFDLDRNDILTDGHPIIFRPNKENNPKYVFYALYNEQEQFEKMAVGSTNQCFLNISDVNHFEIPIVNLQKQKQIADFLDEKCGEIDTLTNDIQEQIETLEEYKKSIITEAVTKGLDPNVEMKDSGIEWIGKIPKHWMIYRYKHLTSLVRGGSPRPAGNPIYYYGDIPFMKVADITKDDRMYVNSCEGSIKPAGLSNTRMVSKGTLLLTNSGATLGVPKILNIDTTINDGIAAFLNLSHKLNIKFAYYSLKSKTEYFLQVAALGMGQPNLNTDIIGNTYVTIPPKYEQQKIINFLDVKCAEIDTVIETKKKQLSLIEEYKKSLIYEYVTGKKEV